MKTIIVMSEVFKINDESICQSCAKVPSEGQSLQCFTCKGVFHAICENTNNESKLGKNTLVKQFLAVSTKENFKFFCNKCLTELEINMAQSSTDKINALEKKYGNMETRLHKIMELLSKEEVTNNKPINSIHTTSNIWLNKEELEKIKAPPAKSMLVVKKADNHENQSVVESAIMSNNIPVVESYQKKSGDLMIICESENARNELKHLVTTSNGNIVISTPREIRHSITIVGLPKAYEKEEIIKMLAMQNGYIKKLTVNNNIEEHIKIHAIKPLRNNPSLFQVFGDVSSFLRDTFRHFFDKVTLGLSSCKIYDRLNVKRCYNCQTFGHYARDCPTKTVHVCGKCSENHQTKDCESLVEKCVNCVRNNMAQTQHQASSHLCPLLVNEQNLLKKKFNDRNLNSTSNRTIPPT